MLRSMTGFGAAAGAGRSGTPLRVEVRSVNHRHLAVKTRLPETLFALESEVEGRVRARCERGAVTVHVAAERGGAGGARIDHALARRYRDELAGLAGELGLAPALSLDALVGLPGVLAAADGADEDTLGQEALALLDEALERMLAMRAREGAALEADLRKHARALAQLAARIEKRMPRVVRANHAGLAKRLQALLGGKLPVARDELAREIALLADKLDVSEELVRLASHLAQLDTLLAKGGRIGRQLDFLVQEILREVNTIGSKCSDATVAHWVVEAKTHVERLREQVQNVE
ncbi:MAG TPA: YicC/YloC family endoribonuclease [Planctomycetota bacterium]